MQEAKCSGIEERVAALESRVAVLESVPKKESVKDEVKDRVKRFMLSHFNVSFIRDDVEADIYDVLIDGLLDIVY